MNETLKFDLIAMKIDIKEEKMHISLPHCHQPIP